MLLDALIPFSLKTLNGPLTVKGAQYLFNYSYNEESKCVFHFLFWGEKLDVSATLGSIRFRKQISCNTHLSFPPFPLWNKTDYETFLQNTRKAK